MTRLIEQGVQQAIEKGYIRLIEDDDQLTSGSLSIHLTGCYDRPMPACKPRPADEKQADQLDGLPQIERFKAVAQELECDEDTAAFEAALRKIATAGPPRKQKQAEK